MTSQKAYKLRIRLYSALAVFFGIVHGGTAHADYIDWNCANECLQDCGDVCGGRGPTKRACILACSARNDECEQSCIQPGEPPLIGQPIVSSLTGTVAITTDVGFPSEPYVNNVSWSVAFDGGRTGATVVAISSWVLDTTAAVPPTVPVFGPNLTTLTLQTPEERPFPSFTRILTVHLNLYVGHSRKVEPFSWDSTLSIDLSASAAPNSTGRAQLSGTGTFVGGWLNGVNCTIVMDGVLTPIP